MNIYAYIAQWISRVHDVPHDAGTVICLCGHGVWHNCISSVTTFYSSVAISLYHGYFRIRESGELIRRSERH